MTEALKDRLVKLAEATRAGIRAGDHQTGEPSADDLAIEAAAAVADESSNG